MGIGAICHRHISLQKREISVFLQANGIEDEQKTEKWLKKRVNVV